MGLAKRDFNRSILPHLKDVLDYEAHIQDIAGRGDDHHEGLAEGPGSREFHAGPAGAAGRAGAGRAE